MTDRHRQALTMSAPAPERAAAEPVKRLAERITAAQRPEIAVTESWLARHPEAQGGTESGKGTASGGAATGGSGAHDHGSAAAGPGARQMPGMATPEQLRELGEARGADVDRLFLRLMTAHHEGP
ncbi:DUF305 domain-containing protein [Streptomyces sp. G-G2]|uniref:DUF305 domain-containing protein n=1 Tax=Streptomyces sp. G-G2 TaxID=3046201 RepID=UPI0024BB3B91|nr:DUF305 domain-containing protein [Streptomyces sp. G-G2]MDJ0381162.1 DUF305 domain-containing protein [Streptomyces sp. G-G2]